GLPSGSRCSRLPGALPTGAVPMPSPEGESMSSAIGPGSTAGSSSSSPPLPPWPGGVARGRAVGRLKSTPFGSTAATSVTGAAGSDGPADDDAPDWEPPPWGSPPCGAPGWVALAWEPFAGFVSDALDPGPPDCDESAWGEPDGPDGEAPGR